MTSPLQSLRDARCERPGPARVARRPHGLSARKGRFQSVEALGRAGDPFPWLPAVEEAEYV